MNIYIFTNHFYPEQFKVNDIAFYLAKKGDKVTVITGIPNYPQGKFFKGYNILKRRKEIVNGVKVIRLPLIPRGGGNKFRLIINYLSYFISSILYIPFIITKKIDCIFVHETSPIFIGLTAVIVKKIKKIPMYFWVLDLWPESVSAASSFSNNFIINAISKFVKWIYENSDKILISSKNFTQSILQKGNFKDKILYFPNWAEDVFLHTKEDVTVPTLPKGFIIMYAGNIGEAQGIESIMEAALMLKDESDIKWVFIGDGRKKNWVDNFINTHLLYNTVYTLGYFSIECMPLLYKKANAMLLSLKNKMIFSLTVPAKLQSYLACGRPIVAMINGETANIIKEAKCGYTSEAEDSAGLAHNILKMYNSSKDQRENMAQNAKYYYDHNFDKNTLLNKLYNLIHMTDSI